MAESSCRRVFHEMNDHDFGPLSPGPDSVFRGFGRAIERTIGYLLILGEGTVPK